jgi:hypothetical protein
VSCFHGNDPDKCGWCQAQEWAASPTTALRKEMHELIDTRSKQYCLHWPDSDNMEHYDEVAHAVAVYEIRNAVERWNSYVMRLER